MKAKGRLKAPRPNRLLAVEPWWRAATKRRRSGSERACAQLLLNLFKQLLN